MPTNYTIPERHERICRPCEFHKSVGAFFGSDHSWQDWNCIHPNAFDDNLREPMSDPEKEKLRVEIISLTGREGRNIGKTERQPEWCPLLKQNQPRASE